MIRLFAVLVCLVAACLPAPALARSQPGYTVSRTSAGVEISVHLERRDYPARALVPVTVTLRNVSHLHLAIGRFTRMNTLCEGPPVRLVAVNAAGQSVEPMPRVPLPIPDCPAPPPELVPLGHSVVEHLLVVLWSSRLLVSAQLANFANRCFCGFTWKGSFVVQVRTHPAPAPAIALRTVGGRETAVVTPPPGARGPMYYRSWGSCWPYVVYWAPLSRHAVSSGCGRDDQWHLDVGWLNGPVATLETGVHAQSAGSAPAFPPQIFALHAGHIPGWTVARVIASRRESNWQAWNDSRPGSLYLYQGQWTALGRTAGWYERLLLRGGPKYADMTLLVSEFPDVETAVHAYMAMTAAAGTTRTLRRSFSAGSQAGEWEPSVGVGSGPTGCTASFGTLVDYMQYGPIVAEISSRVSRSSCGPLPKPGQTVARMIVRDIRAGENF